MAYPSYMLQGSERAPRTAAELERLRAQRQEITSQLDEVTQRRGRLGQERLNARARGDLAMVQEYDATINLLGERMNTLNGQLISADKAIAEAVANGVGQRSQSQTQVFTLPGGQSIGIGPAAIPGMPVVGSLSWQRELAEVRNHYTRLMALEAAGLILLGAIVARWAWVRGRKSVNALAGGAEIAGLRNSVDAIAIEVERISENQRYVTKLMTEGSAAPVAKQFPEPMKRDISR